MIKNEGIKVRFATDVLIFSVSTGKSESCRKLPEKHFSILLVKRNKEPFKNKWCLPGGFVYENETSSQASDRVLIKETNLHNIYKEQLYTFDDVNRDPRDRIISTSYMALVDKTKIEDTISEEAKWFNINIDQKFRKIKIKLESEENVIEFEANKIQEEKTTRETKYETIYNGDLAFDHSGIVVMGILKLRQKAENTDIIFNIMPEYFTLGELQQVYEIILDRKFLEAAFRRTIENKVEKTEKVVKTGGHRPSVLFRYKREI